MNGYLDKIPADAFVPNGICDFCKTKAPVVEVFFGAVSVNEETAEIVEERDPVESNKLCKTCADKTWNMEGPLEYAEAELKKK